MVAVFQNAKAYVLSDGKPWKSDVVTPAGAGGERDGITQRGRGQEVAEAESGKKVCIQWTVCLQGEERRRLKGGGRNWRQGKGLRKPQSEKD